MKIERRRVSQRTIIALPWEGAERPLNQRVVKELAAELLDLARHRALPDTGFNHPIELAPYHDPEKPGVDYRVVAGFHRFDAWIKASCYIRHAEMDLNSLCCTVFVDATDEQLRFLNIRENLHRADLTYEQRMKLRHQMPMLFADSEGALKDIFGRNWQAERTKEDQGFSAARTKPEKSAARTKLDSAKGGRPNGWFEGWYTSTGTPKRTAFDEWHAFCRDTGRAGLKPGKAMPEDRDAFHAWGNARADKRLADAVREAKEAAERRHQEDLAKLKESQLQRLRERIRTFRKEWGEAEAARLLDELRPVPSASAEPEPEPASTQQEAA